MKLHQFPLIALLIAALALGGCSKRSELLDTIPAQSEFVAMVNVKKICSELGITFSETGAAIPGPVKQKLHITDDSNGLLDLLGRLDASGSADVSAVALASFDNALFLTLPIESYDKLKALDCPWLQWTGDAGGFHTGSLGAGLSVLSTDSQMWVLEMSDKASATVRSIIESADKESIGKIDAIAGALAADKYVNLAVLNDAPDGKGDKHEALLQSTWSMIGLTVDGPRLVGDVAVMKGTGETVAVEGMQPINDAVLSYVPSGCSIAFAAGLTPRFSWDFVKMFAGIRGDFQTRAALDVAIPFLSSIDGTLLLAAAPDADDAFSDPDPSNWNFIVMAHMSQEKINQLLGMVRTMMFTAGVTPQTGKDGVMIVPQYGKNLYMGNVDGYFAVSTVPFSNDRDNSLAPTFVGKDAAAIFRLPSLSIINPSAPAGVALDVKGQFDGAYGQVVLTFPGSESSPLLNLLTLI